MLVDDELVECSEFKDNFETAKLDSKGFVSHKGRISETMEIITKNLGKYLTKYFFPFYAYYVIHMYHTCSC